MGLKSHLLNKNFKGINFAIRPKDYYNSKFRITPLIIIYKVFIPNNYLLSKNFKGTSPAIRPKDHYNFKPEITPLIIIYKMSIPNNYLPP